MFISTGDSQGLIYTEILQVLCWFWYFILRENSKSMRVKTTTYILGECLNRLPQSGGGVFVLCWHFADKGVLQMRIIPDIRSFWCKKLRIFESCNISVRTRVEGVEPVQTLCGQKRKSQFFAILCRRLL